MLLHLTEDDVVPPLKKPSPKERTLNRRISYMMSEAGTGQPQLFYPKLDFQPIAFFALGSPIGELYFTLFKNLCIKYL